MIARLLATAVRFRFDVNAAKGLGATFELRVRLLGRPQRLLVAVADGRCEVRPASAAVAGAGATVGLGDMVRMALGLAGWPELLSSGRLTMDGDPFLALRLPALFRLPAGRRRLFVGDNATMGRLRDLVAAAAASRPGSWFFLNVATPVDRRLLPLTNGRISIALGEPVLCLEAVGAKSGAIRRTPLLYTDVDGELVVVASATGRARHPAWYRNVVANPRVRVYAPGGRSGEYLARTAEGEERERLWSRARELYKGYDVYERRTEGVREIPVVVLSRAP